jgi:hypothetical protein
MKYYILLLQNKNFKLTTVLLFDGESGLRSTKTQKIIAEKYNITVHAEAFYKRNMAERAIKEIKLRMAIQLDLEDQPLTKWRNYLDNVVNTINRNKKEYKSVLQMLTAFFTPNAAPGKSEDDTAVHLPQSLSSYYKFNINDTVRINVLPAQRKNMGFKYSLNIGKFPPLPFRVYILSFLVSYCLGKLQHKNNAVVKARHVVSKNRIIIPIYTVYIPALNQVSIAVFSLPSPSPFLAPSPFQISLPPPLFKIYMFYL